MTTSDLDSEGRDCWLAVVEATGIAQRGIAPLTQRKFENWHRHLFNSSPLGTSIRTCVCKPCNCINSKVATCKSCVCAGCKRCADIKAELQRLRGSKPQLRLRWQNSKCKNWRNEPWEVAKVFMNPLGSRAEKVTDASSTDISGLLSLIDWCLFTTMPVDHTVLEDVREARNMWVHESEMELSEDEMENSFTVIETLLKDPVFRNDEDAKNALKELKKLQDPKNRPNILREKKDDLQQKVTQFLEHSKEKKMERLKHGQEMLARARDWQQHLVGERGGRFTRKTPDFDSEGRECWLAVAEANKIEKRGIAPLTQREFKNWHSKLFKSLPLGTIGNCICKPCNCETKSCACQILPKKRRKCKECADIKAALQCSLTSKRQFRFSWRNSKCNNWRNKPWEVAKVFMNPLGFRADKVTDASSTDICGLLSLIDWCLFTTMPVDHTVLEDVREARNMWAHESEMELSEDEMNDSFTVIEKLLKDRVFRNDEDAKKALKELEKLRDPKERPIILRKKEVDLIFEVTEFFEYAVKNDMEILKHLTDMLTKVNDWDRSFVRERKMEGDGRDRFIRDAAIAGGLYGAEAGVAAWAEAGATAGVAAGAAAGAAAGVAAGFAAGAAAGVAAGAAAGVILGPFGAAAGGLIGGTVAAIAASVMWQRMWPWR